MAILTPIDDRELAAFAGQYKLGRFVSARGIEAGTVNTSYALELATERPTTHGGSSRFFVRIYEEQDAAGAGREARVLTHLAAAGVATPAPLVARNGAALGTLAGKPAALFPWIDGDILCTRAVTPAAAEAVGAALARIHRAGHAPDAPLGDGRFSPEALVERCERVRSSRDPDAARLADALRAAAADVARTRRRDVPRGLVHGDLFRDNVLWVGEGDACRIAALLDFESAHDGPFAYDLAVTILSWTFGSTFDFDLARAMVRGYRSVRELEADDRAVLFDECRFAALRFTITRITDEAIRVGKRWQRFVDRTDALERLGPRAWLERLGL
jgi:homoserine kinase type II